MGLRLLDTAGLAFCWSAVMGCVKSPINLLVDEGQLVGGGQEEAIKANREVREFLSIVFEGVKENQVPFHAGGSRES